MIYFCVAKCVVLFFLAHPDLIKLEVEVFERKPSITVTLSSTDVGGEEDEGVVVDEELSAIDTWLQVDQQDIQKEIELEIERVTEQEVKEEALEIKRESEKEVKEEALKVEEEVEKEQEKEKEQNQEPVIEENVKQELAYGVIPVFLLRLSNSEVAHGHLRFHSSGNFSFPYISGTRLLPFLLGLPFRLSAHT